LLVADPSILSQLPVLGLVAESVPVWILDWLNKNDAIWLLQLQQIEEEKSK